MNKRGQELSVTTIILIVIGLLVLVLLIIGFTIGWKKIFPWIKPTNNVKDIADQCKISCSINSKYDFCTVKRELRAEDKTLQEINCDFLAEMKQEYGVEKCTAIQCDVESYAGIIAASDFKLAENKQPEPVKKILANCAKKVSDANADEDAKKVACASQIQYLEKVDDKTQKLIVNTCKGTGLAGCKDILI